MGNGDLPGSARDNQKKTSHSSLAIVGHGPSLVNFDYGQHIDAHDEVMRMKPSKALLARPHIFGAKTNHVVGSLVASAHVFENWKDIVPKFYFFVDTRTEDVTEHEIKEWLKTLNYGGVVIDRALCMDWIEIYRDMRTAYHPDKAQESKGKLSDIKGHRHFSIGLFSLLHALHYLKPKTITLYGFDNVASGEFTWSLTRGDDYTEYPDHNWMTENLLMMEMAGRYGYGVKIEKDKCLITLKRRDNG